MKLISMCILFILGAFAGRLLNTASYCIPEKKITKNWFGYHGMEDSRNVSFMNTFMYLPIAGYLLSRESCKKSGQKISIQYPLIEAGNGFVWVLIVLVCGNTGESVLYCLLASALLLLSAIDFRIYEIPTGINYFIGCLGIINVIWNRQQWLTYVIGFFSVGLFLYLLYWVSHGGAIGGGDVRLMACAGLLLGWQKIILAFFLGCIFGSVIHIARMKISKQGHMLAMGPYLALGILTAALYGNAMIHWYLSLCLA